MVRRGDDLEPAGALEAGGRTAGATEPVERVDATVIAVSKDGDHQ
jgi:K+/H+ antiporter YhaU regulatory subunit KhtT